MNNTIIHECVHWDLHRKAFALEHLYNSSAIEGESQVVGGIKDRSAAEWVEWHASALGPRIQMPLAMFIANRWPFSSAQEILEKRVFQLAARLRPAAEKIALFGVSGCP